MLLYTVTLCSDGTPSLDRADESAICASFQDPLREEALQKAEAYRKDAWEQRRQAHKLNDAISHLRKFVRGVKAGTVQLDDVVAMLNRTSDNIIALEAVGGGFQATPMPDATIPE